MDSSKLSLHHWAVPVNQHRGTVSFVVFCNHRGRPLPDFLAVAVSPGDGAPVAKRINVDEAVGMMGARADLFAGMDRISDYTHISDALALATEVFSAMRGTKSKRYKDYLTARKELSFASQSVMGHHSDTMSHYGHGMSAGNGAVGSGMYNHYGDTMTQYGHGMSAGNGAVGSGMYNHYGNTMGHDGSTFSDMG